MLDVLILDHVGKNLRGHLVIQGLNLRINLLLCRFEDMLPRQQALHEFYKSWQVQDQVKLSC